MAPRHIELLLQTAGVYELGNDGRMALPQAIGRVVRFRDPGATDGPLYSVVRRTNGAFDAELRDPSGAVYLRLEGYRTIELPGGADPEHLNPILEAFNGKKS